MENSKLNRINELAKLAKERDLTPEELSERDALRKEYIAEWRRGAEQVLENTYIVPSVSVPASTLTPLRHRMNASAAKEHAELKCIYFTCFKRYTP